MALVLKGLSVPGASCSLAKEACCVTSNVPVLWPELAFHDISDAGGHLQLNP